jgi:hypothetical protein
VLGFRYKLSSTTTAGLNGGAGDASLANGVSIAECSPVVNVAKTIYLNGVLSFGGCTNAVKAFSTAARTLVCFDALACGSVAES